MAQKRNRDTDLVFEEPTSPHPRSTQRFIVPLAGDGGRLASVMDQDPHGEVPVAAGLVPHPATHLIECFVGPHDDVKRIHAYPGVRATQHHQVGDPVRAVGDDQRDLGATSLAEQIENAASVVWAPSIA